MLSDQEAKKDSKYAKTTYSGASFAASQFHRSWISHATHKFLTEIVDKFGRPETPIVIQRGTNKGFAAEAAKTHDGSPPATCVSPSGGGTKD